MMGVKHLNKIKNYSELLDSFDFKENRKIVLEIANRTLKKVDSYEKIKKMMNVSSNGVLSIGEKTWNLNKYDGIYLIVAGKAANAMTKAFMEKIGSYITQGISVVKVIEKNDYYKNVNTIIGGHPLPNEESKKAAEGILQMIKDAPQNSLFLTGMSGGSSALLSLPFDPITLEEEKKSTDILLKSGANIYEINSIRRHISQINGGRLAQKIKNNGSEMIGFGISDAVGNMPTKKYDEPYEKYNSTPIGPDNTTIQNARNVISKYKLESKLPTNILNFFKNADESKETPKSFEKNTYYLINTVPDLGIAAKRSAEELGLKAKIVTSFLEGESKQVARFIGSIAKEKALLKSKNDCNILIFVGETTTIINDSEVIGGHGGPSSEIVAAFAEYAKSLDSCFLSIDTEGTDGTTNYAGGIVDKSTYNLSKKKKVDIGKFIRSHATFEYLKAVNSAIYTGNTGTNLCDLNILYIP